MHLQENEYYQYDLNTVIDMLLDDDYHRQKATKIRGGRNYQVLSHKKNPDFYHIKIQYDEYVQLPDNFPKRYKKYVKASNTYITTVEWQLKDKHVKTGNVTIEIPGMPVTVYGVLNLKNCEGGCERQIEINFRYKLPIIGKFISNFFSGLISQSLLAEYEFNRVFLEKNAFSLNIER